MQAVAWGVLLSSLLAHAIDEYDWRTNDQEDASPQKESWGGANVQERGYLTSVLGYRPNAFLKPPNALKLAAVEEQLTWAMREIEESRDIRLESDVHALLKSLLAQAKTPVGGKFLFAEVNTHSFDCDFEAFWLRRSFLSAFWKKAKKDGGHASPYDWSQRATVMSAMAEWRGVCWEPDFERARELSSSRSCDEVRKMHVPREATIDAVFEAEGLRVVHFLTLYGTEITLHKAAKQLRQRGPSLGVVHLKGKFYVSHRPHLDALLWNYTSTDPNAEGELKWLCSLGYKKGGPNITDCEVPPELMRLSEVMNRTLAMFGELGLKVMYKDLWNVVLFNDADHTKELAEAEAASTKLAEDLRRQHVLGFAVGVARADLTRFVASVCAHTVGESTTLHIFVSASEWPSVYADEQLTRLTSAAAVYFKISMINDEMMHPNVMSQVLALSQLKQLVYARWVHDFAGPHDEVVLAEVSSAAFQTNPFELLGNANKPISQFEDYLLLSQAPAMLSEYPRIARHTGQLFGTDVLAELQGAPLSRSELVVGTTRHIQRYLDAMAAQIEHGHFMLRVDGVDKALHNFVAHFDAHNFGGRVVITTAPLVVDVTTTSVRPGVELPIVPLDIDGGCALVRTKSAGVLPVLVHALSTEVAQQLTARYVHSDVPHKCTATRDDAAMALRHALRLSM